MWRATGGACDAPGDMPLLWPSHVSIDGICFVDHHDQPPTSEPWPKRVRVF